MDKRGILTYLAITLGATYLVGGAIVVFDLVRFDEGGWAGMAALFGLLWIPALAARVASRQGAGELWPKPTLWPLSKVAVLAVMAGVAVVFVAVYAVTAVFGWTEPDWEVTFLMHTLKGRSQDLPPWFFLMLGFGLSLVLGPTLCALLCLGGELGWRGYLLPKLLPLGRLRAYLLIGVLYSMWLVPLSFRHGAAAPTRWKFVLPTLAMVLILNAILSELWRRRRHTGWTAVCAGCFLSQAQLGMWMYLFPNQRSVWAGPFGLVSLSAWALIALVYLVLPQGKAATVPERAKPDPAEEAPDAPEPPGEENTEEA